MIAEPIYMINLLLTDRVDHFALDALNSAFRNFTLRLRVCLLIWLVSVDGVFLRLDLLLIELE